MVGMGQYVVTARQLRNSRAGGGQRHRQRPFVTSTRIDVDRAFLGDGHQTRGSNNADSFFLCDTHLVFSVECVLQTPHSVSGTGRPIRHMLVTVFVFFDLASYVVVTTYDTRPTRTIGMTDV